mmetsp:Transcript_13793/g.25665  ORF Transcript_13793/g.25665 Transcript_13793/m.25665 type:complete len:574 (-) Transcript_13793:449-2170(-)
MMGSSGSQGSCCFEQTLGRGNPEVGAYIDRRVARVEIRGDSNGELDQKERGLWAAEHLSAGEVIFSNRPCAHVLTGQHLQSRCTHCLCTAPEGDILSQCGKCKFVRYCGAQCQRADWAQHRAECAALAGSSGTGPNSERFSLLDACRHAGLGEEDVLRDTRLALRLSVLFTLAPDEVPVSASCRVVAEPTQRASDSSNDAVSIQCGAAHVMDMCSGEKAGGAAAHDTVVQFVTRLLSKGRKKKTTLTAPIILSLLQKFQVNNFGITDDLLQCIGAGVFPATALLNHSCQPSCILRYSLSRCSPPCLAVVALPELYAGLELTHSYVDLAQPTAGRQTKLNETYGFFCTCNRCLDAGHGKMSGANCAQVSQEFSKSGSIEETLQLSLSVECNSLYGKLSEQQHATLVTLNVEKELCAFRVCDGEAATAITEAARWQREAAMAGLADDAVAGAREEVRCLEHALAVLLGACGPFHFEVYKVHGQLMSASLMTGDYPRALRYCFLIVGYLRLVFSDVPQHPLLGLQLYTLGDILTTQPGKAAEALQAFRISHEILKFAFGHTNIMVRRLEDSMRDLN